MDNFQHTDVDECGVDSNPCDQICDNTEGSFLCSCNTGYELQENGQTCLGNNEVITP